MVSEVVHVVVAAKHSEKERDVGGAGEEKRLVETKQEIGVASFAGAERRG